jgi:hypothetical protein
MTGVATETIFVGSAICSLLLLTGGSVPGPVSVLKFVCVFFVLNLAGRMVSDDMGNKISFAALAGIGAKACSLLVPKIVAW